MRALLSGKLRVQLQDLYTKKTTMNGKGMGTGRNFSFMVSSLHGYWGHWTRPFHLNPSKWSKIRQVCSISPAVTGFTWSLSCWLSSVAFKLMSVIKHSLYVSIKSGRVNLIGFGIHQEIGSAHFWLYLGAVQRDVWPAPHPFLWCCSSALLPGHHELSSFAPPWPSAITMLPWNQLTMD